MERTLIIASGEKAGPTLARFLAGCGLTAPPTFASSGAEARRRLHESEYDLIFLNAPLSDEFGGELAQRAAHETSASVFLLVKAEIADDISAKVEQDGIGGGTQLFNAAHAVPCGQVVISVFLQDIYDYFHIYLLVFHHEYQGFAFQVCTSFLQSEVCAMRICVQNRKYTLKTITNLNIIILIL